MESTWILAVDIQANSNTEEDPMPPMLTTHSISLSESISSGGYMIPLIHVSRSSNQSERTSVWSRQRTPPSGCEKLLLVQWVEVEHQILTNPVTVVTVTVVTPNVFRIVKRLLNRVGLKQASCSAE